MSDREKELTILVTEGCKLTTEMLPHWEYCRNLALRMNQHLGGGISVKFNVISDLLCEFRWRGKHVATFYFLNTAPDEVRIRACNFGGELPRSYPIAQVWERIFQPALGSLLYEERRTLEQALEEMERKIPMSLP